MIWPKLAVSLLLIAAVLAGFAVYVLHRAASRDTALLATHPPTGQILTVNGLRVQVLIAGAGPDLILIHGASGNARDVTLALANRLTKDHRVIAFDRPGLGHSDPLPDDSLAAQALHLSAAALQLGISNPLVVGQSYGGSVALAWALHSPLKPRALVLIASPSLPWPGPLDIWYRLNNTALGAALLIPLATAFVSDTYINASIEGIFRPALAPPGYAKAIDAPMTLRRSALRANLSQVNALRAQLVDMEPLYARLALPIEIIHGSADTIVPLHIHSRPFSALHQNAHLTVIDGAGHMPHYSHPDVVIAAIARAALRSPHQSP
jgi:pimeloyl-ACP methyl ester carboxylesterase